MTTTGLIVAFVALVVSLYVTRSAIAWALGRRLIDVPNERSSHTVPTPRGGGLGIVAGAIAGLAPLAMAGMLQLQFAGALACGCVIAVLGYLDDRHSLSVRIRLVIQALAATVALALLWPLPPLELPGVTVPPPLAAVLYFLGLVWLTNLYNFMDGIDGIAGAQAVAVCLVWAFLAPASEIGGVALVLAAANLGFIRYNWPPARIFMGDTGSAFVGFELGVCAIALAAETTTSVLLWLIPLAGFIADATATLLVRIARGRRPGEAHRSHLYQRLSRRLGRHSAVTILYFVLVLAVLGPLTLLAVGEAPANAAVTLLIVVLALSLSAIGLGAGRDDG